MTRSMLISHTSGIRAGAARLSKFAVVGATGALVNTGLLMLLYQHSHLPLVAASALAVEVSVIHNFMWNDRWTFGSRTWSFPRLLRFNGVSLGGLAVTATTLWALVAFARVPYVWANLVGIGLAMLLNFAINSFWTWGSRLHA